MKMEIKIKRPRARATAAEAATTKPFDFYSNLYFDSTLTL